MWIEIGKKPCNFLKKVNNYFKTGMQMKAIEFWESISEDNKALIKKICIGAIATYVLFQLVAFLFPILLTFGVTYWAYKKYVDPNPRILK